MGVYSLLTHYKLAKANWYVGIKGPYTFYEYYSTVLVNEFSSNKEIHVVAYPSCVPEVV